MARYEDRVSLEVRGDFETSDFVAIVREVCEGECGPKLPEARLVVRPSRRDHVVRFLSWPRRVWKLREARRAERERRIERAVADVLVMVAKLIVSVMPKDPK
jgi:hypothetical protein